MCRSVFALVHLLAACAVLAAPAPKDRWERVDLDRNCKIVFKDNRVTMELPGGDHDLAPKRERFNAPRLLREVAGDFVLQVRVSGSFRPSAKSTVDRENPRVAAGLVLIPADENYIRLEYEACRLSGELISCPEFRMQGEKLFNVEMGWEVPWKMNADARKEKQIYLQLERQGHFIYEAISHDGKKWNYQFGVEDHKLPVKLKVGLAAYSTSTEPFNPRFDNIKLQVGWAKTDFRKPGTIFKNLK